MSSQSSSKRAPIRSTWTPMSNDETNAKYFEERRQLIIKWYEKWTEDQRKIILDDLLSMCKLSTLELIAKDIEPLLPKRAVDFTLLLPQHLVLNIFSYLDPRSLCRCSQVNTHWKWVAENDALWIVKCAKLGWTLSFEPTPFERGVWKANYVEHFRQLQQAGMLREPDRKMLQLEAANTERSDSDKSLSGRSGAKLTGPPKRNAAGQKPWRAPDKSPMDTWRFNYLDERELDGSPKKTTTVTVQSQSRVDSGSSATNGKKANKSKLRATLIQKYQAENADLQRSSSLDRLAELTANDINRVSNSEMMFVTAKPGATNGTLDSGRNSALGTASVGLYSTVTLNNRPLWAQPKSVQATTLTNGSSQAPNGQTVSSRIDSVPTGRSILSTNGKPNGTSSKTQQKTRFQNDSDSMFSPKPWNTNAASNQSTPANSQR